MTPDVDVLVAAFRDDHDDHRQAAAWLSGALSRARAGEPLVLPVVVTGYLRIVQLPAPFPVPTPADEALRAAETLIRSEGVVVASLGAEWPIFADLFRKHRPRRGDVTDAWIAAAVLHLGEHLVTFDRGFRRLLPPDRLTVLGSDTP